MPRFDQSPRRYSRIGLQGLMSLGLLVLGSGSRADPGYYVVTTYSDPGIVVLDTRFWTVKSPGRPVVKWPEVGVGYGVNSRWYTEVFASYIGSADQPMSLSSMNWQNDYLLTQGQYPFDLAVHTNLIRNLGYGGGYVIEYGPVLQTDVGRTQLNANVFFEHGYRQDASAPTQMKYQWQARYRWKPLLNIGLQGFGELGRWDKWAPRDQQSHRAGPAVFGTIRTDRGQALHYQAAFLMGSVYGRSGTMFSARVRLEF